MASGTRRLGVIGFGRMAEAMVAGALDRGTLRPGEVLGARRDPAKAADVTARLGVPMTDDVTRVLAECDRVMLAVKPQQLPTMFERLAGHWRPEHVVVSVIAGVSTGAFEAACGPGPRPVVRTMPNTPCLVGEGIVGMCLGVHGTEAHAADVEAMFSAVAEFVRVPEAQIDALTAVSGSGPAYVFALAEAFYAAAEGVGLAPEVARRLVDGTLRGAVALLEASPMTASELREQVTSPGGTTEAGLAVMAARGLPEMLAEVVVAARDRGLALREGA